MFNGYELVLSLSFGEATAVRTVCTLLADMHSITPEEMANGLVNALADGLRDILKEVAEELGASITYG